MKYKGIYWALFAPLMKKSITARFGSDLAETAIRRGKAEHRDYWVVGDQVANPQ